MAKYKVKIDNDVAGVGLGGIVSDLDLEGWDLPHLLKTGALEVIESPAPTSAKDKE